MRQERALVDLIPKLLEYLEERAEPRAALYWLLVVIGETSECESTAIRWKAGEDYPYYVSRGFSQEFLQQESSLYERDSAGLILRHPDERPQLACMCGAVVEGRTDPSHVFFSPGGSFWTNGITALLRDTPPTAMTGIRTRNYCNAASYESVALIPLRTNGNIYGLLQLNSRKPGRFTAEKIEWYEELGRKVTTAAVPRLG